MKSSMKNNFKCVIKLQKVSNWVNVRKIQAKNSKIWTAGQSFLVQKFALDRRDVYRMKKSKRVG